MTNNARDERRCLLIVTEVMSSPKINVMPAAWALDLVKALIIATSPNPDPTHQPQAEGVSA